VIDTILGPLYYAVSAILLGWHWVFTRLGLGEGSGLTWALSIVGLTVVIRTILIPLFVKQIHASRKMAVIQPKVREITKKYKDDREKQSQELMKLYKEEKTNPFSSCLPLLLQSPVFFALFRVLEGAAKDNPIGRGLLSPEQAANLHNAQFLGAGISDKFIGADNLTVQLVTIVLIVAMSATTFVTQRQLTRKNLPPEALTGPFAQQQKLMLYAFPLIFAVTGVNFPIGVLLYWLTTNLWTAGQQYYVIKHNPTPGSAAWDELIARRKAAGQTADVALPRAIAAEGSVDTSGGSEVTTEVLPPSSRQQPRRTTRSARSGTPAASGARVTPRPGARPAQRPGRAGSSPQRRPGR